MLISKKARAILYGGCFSLLLHWYEWLFLARTVHSTASYYQHVEAWWFFLLSGKLFQKLHCMYFHILRRLMVHKEIHEALLTTWRIFSLLQSHFRTIWKEFLSRVFLWQNMRSSFFTKYSITLIKTILKAMVEHWIMNFKMYWFF